MEKKFTILLTLLMFLLIPVTTAYAYGGGGSGGGVSQAEDSSFGGGAVSWAPNPNGADVIGSSIWRGRPENIEKGPYQPGKAVEDAEQDLLDGFRSGQYSADEVKANLAWAQRVGISISNEAQQTLDKINNPPKTPIKQKTNPGKSGQLTTQQQNNKAANIIKYVNDYYQLKDKRKQQGRKLTKADLYSIGAKNAVKDKVPKKIKKYVDKVFDVFGY
ncbi:MAG: hypothetical protein JXC33_05325 [Deltaproteobacteria bacterium]|nr:hypothetical protein [Deltaproteobacteria bacterium]